MFIFLNTLMLECSHTKRLSYTNTEKRKKKWCMLGLRHREKFVNWLINITFPLYAFLCFLFKIYVLSLKLNNLTICKQTYKKRLKNYKLLQIRVQVYAIVNVFSDRSCKWKHISEISVFFVLFWCVFVRSRDFIYGQMWLHWTQQNYVFAFRLNIRFHVWELFWQDSVIKWNFYCNENVNHIFLTNDIFF